MLDTLGDASLSSRCVDGGASQAFSTGETPNFLERGLSCSVATTVFIYKFLQVVYPGMFVYSSRFPQLCLFVCLCVSCIYIHIYTHVVGEGVQFLHWFYAKNFRCLADY